MQEIKMAERNTPDTDFIHKMRSVVFDLHKEIKGHLQIPEYKHKNPYELTSEELEVVRAHRRSKDERTCQYCKREFKSVKIHLRSCKIRISQEAARKDLNKNLLFKVAEAMGWAMPVFGVKPYDKKHVPDEGGMIEDHTYIGIIGQTLKVYMGVSKEKPRGGYRHRPHLELDIDLGDPDIDFGPELRRQINEVPQTHYHDQFVKGVDRIKQTMCHQFRKYDSIYGDVNLEMTAEINLKVTITLPNGDMVEDDIVLTDSVLEEAK